MSDNLACVALDDEPCVFAPLHSSDDHRLRGDHVSGVTAGAGSVTNEIRRKSRPVGCLCDANPVGWGTREIAFLDVTPAWEQSDPENRPSLSKRVRSLEEFVRE
jgi:hypothetical protein